ncbi:MAG: hypothetical protein KAU50_11490 [Candidatus Marinimicrobia bacterium]|nr:hypothetical protein [Candidatus Neomarinimicrobiota bacterium]
MNEKEIEKFWEAIKDSNVISGAIIGLSWNQLWPEVKDMIKEIYEKVMK